MKIYYGSNVEVKEPGLNYSAKNRDFGQGFYLTSDKNQAKSWAIKKVNLTQIGSPVVSMFEIYESEFEKLNVKRYESANEEWFNYVLKNRKDKNYYDEYDIVIGPVANDNTTPVISLYLDGFYDAKEAIKRLMTYVLKDQYTIITEKALSYLHYDGVIVCE